jgi:hypothetical protein
MKNKIRHQMKIFICLLTMAGLFGTNVSLHAQSVPSNEKQSKVKLSSEITTTNKPPVKKISDKKHKVSKIEPTAKKPGKQSTKVPASK